MCQSLTTSIRLGSQVCPIFSSTVMAQLMGQRAGHKLCFVPCQFGMTPLMFAVKRQKLKVVKTLVGKAFADVNVAENVSARAN